MRNYKGFIRNVGKMNHVNDGTRSLFESIKSPEVLLALNDWISNDIENCVLIGGLALSFYIKPRYTQDVDVLFISKEDIPENVYKFKRNRKSAFQHDKTHVEVEMVTPEIINTTVEIIEKVFETSNMINGIKVASPAGLVALKLNRFSLQDQADIAALVEYTNIDLTPFNLSEDKLEKYNELLNRI